MADREAAELPEGRRIFRPSPAVVPRSRASLSGLLQRQCVGDRGRPPGARNAVVTTTISALPSRAPQVAALWQMALAIHQRCSHAAAPCEWKMAGRGPTGDRSRSLSPRDRAGLRLLAARL